MIALFGGGGGAYLIADSWADTQHQLLSNQEAAKIRLDAVRTALAVAGGLGAAATLLLAVRRQSASEYAQQASEDDAAERRITELYVAAVEQLGSDKAPVRLGGLYALDRIGNDHPKMRQTVIDVWCAYLRMPYTPPYEVLRTDAEGSPHHVAREAPKSKSDEQAAQRQELQVRLTAQRLIAIHLRVEAKDAEPATYWRGFNNERMSLDLTSATLVRLEFSRVVAESAELADTNHHGYSNFSGARFHSPVDLGRAKFHGYTSLGYAQFYGGLDLTEARFHGRLVLAGAEIHGCAYLCEARFYGDVYLSQTQFHDDAVFAEARIYGDVDLRETRFHGNDQFGGAAVRGDTWLPAGWRLEDEPDPDDLHRVVEDIPAFESVGARISSGSDSPGGPA